MLCLFVYYYFILSNKLSSQLTIKTALPWEEDENKLPPWLDTTPNPNNLSSDLRYFTQVSSSYCD